MSKVSVVAGLFFVVFSIVPPPMRASAQSKSTKIQSAPLREDRLTSKGNSVDQRLSLKAPDANILDRVQLLALDQSEQFGVFFVPGEGLVSVRAKQTIPGTLAKLSRVTVDKVVLVETQLGGGGAQQVWMYKTQGIVPGAVKRFSSAVVPELHLLPPTIVSHQDEPLKEKVKQ